MPLSGMECVQVFQFSQQGLIDPIISNLSDEEISQEPQAYLKLSTNTSGMDKRYTGVYPASVARRRSTSRSSRSSTKC